MKNRSIAQIILINFFKTIGVIVLLLGVGVLSYYLTMLFLKQTQRVERSTQYEHVIDVNPGSMESSNLIYSYDKKSGKIDAMVLELFDAGTKNMTYVTIPASTQITISAKTYNDLLKKEYKGLIAMPDPKTSGTGYAFLLNVVNIMGENKAVKYFTKLKENLREFTSSGSGPTNLLKQGEIAIAMGMTSQGVAAINEGYDFSIVELDTGALYNTTSCGIIKGKETNKNVKKVFEFLITKGITNDSQNFLPEGILKDKTSNVKNYPVSTKNADMTGIEDINVKSKLTELWKQVNG